MQKPVSLSLLHRYEPMMKKAVLILLAFLPTYFVAQTNQITALDTHVVKYTVVPSFFNKEDDASANDDTLYYLANIEYAGKWVIYYDESKKTKASEIDYFKKDDNLRSFENSWYRDGTIKKTKTWSETKDTFFVKEYYQNGKLKRDDTAVINPDRTSASTIKSDWYYGNGQIVQTPINNTLHTPQPFERYYKTGQKSAEGTYLNGKYTGLYKTYYKTGQISSEGTYFKNGNLGGIYKEYYENGTIKADCIYKIPKNPDESNKVSKCEHYYENGKLKDVLRRKGKRDRYKTYYDNGKLNEKIVYKNEEVKRAKMYYSNGRLREKSRYRNGKEVKRKFYDGGQSGRTCMP